MQTPAQLQEILSKIEPLSEHWVEAARKRTAQLVMPTRALGRLHEIAEQLCGIRRNLQPSVRRKAVLIMAADHGVVAEGVSAYPQSVTGAMIRTFLRGGAAINVLARQAEAEVRIVDMGTIVEAPADFSAQSGRLQIVKLGYGTANMAHGAAMSRAQAVESILAGFKLASELFGEGFDVLATGDMGIGNTTPATAIGAVVTGNTVQTMVGRGTGLDDAGLRRKQKVIEQAIAVNAPNPRDALEVLSKVGGFEIGGIAGSVLAGAFHHRPVVIDGLISTAGALIAHLLCPQATDYVIAGHCSQEPGHPLMLAQLGRAPLLSLEMRLGEGTGAVLAMSVVEAAAGTFCEMMTFEQAGIG
jgi:nicotinate-nucleotide--dimethylbenzimidazole phosphoribosyltransferase